ncbi:MAG: IPTL-CTERM sorting domain-containing protein [Betaproteobacteria bacterium]
MIANWDKSGRSWNNSHMTTIKAAMTAAGHRVDGDAAITAASVATAAVYILGEPTTAPTPTELEHLRQFVNRGGMLLVFGDTGINLPAYNNLLAGVGSTITYVTTTIGTTSALPDGKFTRAPINIIGNSLTVSSGNGTAGGTLIDNNYVRYEQLGAGYVLAFGDRIDHNDVISATNIALLLNAVSFAISPLLPIPTLSALALIGLALLTGAFAAVRLRRSRNPA